MACTLLFGTDENIINSINLLLLMAKIIPNVINVNVKKEYLLPDLCGEVLDFAQISFKDAAGGRARGATGGEENHSCTLRYEQLSWNPSHSARNTITRHSSLLFKYFFSRKGRGGEVNRSCAAGACTSTSWSQGVRS